MAENQAKPARVEKQVDKDFRHLVRIANTDLDGHKSILYALQKIKGVSVMYANLVCYLAGIDKTKKTGELLNSETKRLDEVLENPHEFGVPSWMMNRRKDYEKGEDVHLVGPNLTFTKDIDIKRLKKIKSNRGFRHHWGLPLRGQRTKANFRKSRGKGTLGVKRKSAAKQGKKGK